MAKATYLLRKAGELVKERRYQDAVEVYLQATETDPTDARAWFGLGVCLYKVDNLDVARIALDRAQRMGYPRADEALARVEAADRRRAAAGTGAKATVAPAEVRRRDVARPPAKEPPPRPPVRPEEQRIDLDRYLRVMLVENIDGDRLAIAKAIEGTIKHAAVSAVDYGASTSDTMSGTVHYDAAVLDWDTAPDAATGLIQILKIKRPGLLVICLTERWDPETAVEILEAGADYHLVKQPHFAATIPLILAQWTRRDRAIAYQSGSKAKDGPSAVWPEALDSLGMALLLVDADLTILQANRTAMKQFRKGEEEFAGRLYCTIFYGEDEPPADCPVLRALEKGEPSAGELNREDLRESFRVQAWPVRTYAGKVASAVVLVRQAEPEERAAEALQDREWLYRSLAEKSNAGVALIGPDGNVRYANRALCTMLDQTEEEIGGQAIEEFLPVQEQESLHECLQKALDAGEAGERLTFQRPDGATFPAEARLASFPGPDGTYLILTVLGVEELEEAEQELWGEARKWSAVLDEGMARLLCGIVVLDAGGRVTWANQAAAGLFGQEGSDLRGSGYLQMVKQNSPRGIADAADFCDALTQAHSRGEAIEDRPLRVGPETFSYWSTPLAGGSSFARRVEHFYRVPAAPVQVSLPTGPEALAGLAAAMPEMLFTSDPEGKITWCNDAAAQTAGHAAHALQGMALADLAAPESRDGLQELLDQALDAERQVHRRELLMARPDGARYWGELTLLAMGSEQVEGSHVVHGVLRDVTDRKVAEAIRDILTGQRAL
jgi:PAS domain S-box-containing protein